MGVVIIAALCIIGCSAKKKDGQKSSAETSSDIFLYYVDQNWSELIPQEMDMDQLATTENLIDTIMTDIIEVGDTSGAITPVPQGMTYQRYIYDGTGTIDLVFSVDWDNVDAYAVVLSKAAFVRTLRQIKSVSKVVYEMVDVENEDNVVREELTEDSFVDMGNITDSEKDTRLYLPDTSGQALVERVMTLDYSSMNSLEEQVLIGLEASYDGTVSPFGDSIVVRGVFVEDGICTVTFNEAMAKGSAEIDDEILIYSVVNSLMEIDGVEGVRMKIENSNDRLNSIDLSRVFKGAYTRVGR